MARVRVVLPNTFLFNTDIPIRIDDINYGGHMGHDAVLTLVHEARIHFFNSLGFQEHDVDGFGILVADAAIEYKAQGFRGDILHIQIGVTDVGRKGCDLVYRLTNRDSGVEVAVVKTGIVFFDYHKHQVVRIPPLFLQRLDLE